MTFASQTPTASPPTDSAEVSSLKTVKSLVDFEAELTSSEQPVLVKFEKKDCPKCKEAEPVVEQIAKDNSGKLNVFKAWMWDDSNPDNRSMKKISGKYKFKTVPYFILFQKGEVLLQSESLVTLEGKLHTLGLKSAKLPNPDIPEGAKLTVLFDGQCTICQNAAKKLKALPELALIPLQSGLVSDKFPDLKTSELKKTIHVVNQQGNVYTGAYAFQAIAKETSGKTLLGKLLKLYGIAAHVPGFLPLFDWGYRLFSKHRFRFQAQQSDCEHCKLED